MSETFVTSDPHFSHQNIIRYCNRPFRDAAEMDEKIIMNWNETVNPEDTVWILGDFGFLKTIDNVKEITERLNGHKILVLGNHDRMKPEQYLEAGFDTVYTGEVMTTIQNTKFCMSHYQHLFWDDSHNGSMHLFGHEHWTEQFEPKHEIYSEMQASERKFNVCMDANGFKPVNIKHIIHLLNKREINFKNR